MGKMNEQRFESFAKLNRVRKDYKDVLRFTLSKFDYESLKANKKATLFYLNTLYWQRIFSTIEPCINWRENPEELKSIVYKEKMRALEIPCPFYTESGAEFLIAELKAVGRILSKREHAIEQKLLRLDLELKDVIV